MPSVFDELPTSNGALGLGIVPVAAALAFKPGLEAVLPRGLANAPAKGAAHEAQRSCSSTVMVPSFVCGVCKWEFTTEEEGL